MNVQNNLDDAEREDTRNIITSENEGRNVCETATIVVSMVIVIILFPFSMFFCLVVVTEYERAVILRLGRLMYESGKPRGPGMFFIIPCTDMCIKVDLRTTSFDVPPQEILTKDSVTIQLDAVVYYRILDPLKAVIQVEFVHDSTKLLAQTTLRNIAGTKKLMELLADKDAVSQAIERILDEGTDPWGVKVERVEIKDVRLPIALQRAMAAEAEAVREAKAKIVAAEGEMNASVALKEASDVMAQNPIALQLRYLQTLASISTERNSTIIFPFPIELFGMAKK